MTFNVLITQVSNQIDDRTATKMDDFLSIDNFGLRKIWLDASFTVYF